MKKGWQTKTLDSCCEQIFAGGDVPKDRFSEEQTENFSVPIYSNGEKNDGLYGFTDLARVTKPSITVSARGTLGFTAIRTEPFLPVVRLIVLVPDEKQITLSFLYYALVGMDFENTGTSIPQLTVPNFKESKFPVPPLAEQQRIVGLLDEAFEGLATAKANAEKNLQNARALFESHLQSVFTQRGPGWVEKHLKEVCEKITDGTHQTPKYFDEGVVFLSSRNVTSGKIDWENIKYIDTKQHLEMHKRVAPRRGDILLAKNGTTGVAAIVDRDTVFDIYVSLAHLRALPVIRPRFLLHFINSPAAKLQFNKRLKGIGVPNLHLEEIREVRIAFPADLKAQDHVVGALDDLHEETQRLARLYERKQAALEALNKSLLHQAFTGEL